MIYTCTMNPAIDYRMEFDQIHLGELNRTTYNRFSAGGKGINVSIVLGNLGSPSKALGFMGGFTGVFLEQYLLDTYALPSSFTPIKDTTRINVKLSEGKRETELNAKAPIVTNEEFERFMKEFDHLRQDDILVLAGSGVKVDENPYEKIAKLCDERNIDFVVDVEKDSLRRSLPYKPLLIKPNRYELETFFETNIGSDEDLLTYGQKLLEMGARNLIISLGKDGSYFLCEKGTYKAKAIKGDAKNPVGAGDSMVAGFLYEYQTSKDVVKAYKMAVAAGTASAFSYELASKKEIEEMLNQVEVIEVKK